MSLKYDTQEITPSIAASWLTRTAKVQRNLRKDLIERYAADMAAGNWSLTGQGLLLDEYGNLLDGQHRLWACIQADVPFTTTVVRGVAVSAFSDMDTGGKRSAANMFESEQIPYATLASSVAGSLWRYRLGVSVNGGGIRVPSNAEIWQTWVDNPDLATSVEFISNMAGSKRNLYNSPTICTLMHFLITEKSGDVEAVNGFFTQLFTGVGNFVEGDPILRLKNRLEQAKLARKTLNKQHVMDNQEKAYITIRAWNAWRQGKTLNPLRAYQGKALPDILA